ncbi:hypothetical protein MHYP_G00271900 [Metynnis hypsauchen]
MPQNQQELRSTLSNLRHLKQRSSGRVQSVKDVQDDGVGLLSARNDLLCWPHAGQTVPVVSSNCWTRGRTMGLFIVPELGLGVGISPCHSPLLSKLEEAEGECQTGAEVQSGVHTAGEEECAHYRYDDNGRSGG